VFGRAISIGSDGTFLLLMCSYLMYMKRKILQPREFRQCIRNMQERPSVDVWAIKYTNVF
jgi:hypothetical protein